MKILRNILLFLFILFIVAGVAFFVFLKTVDLNQFKSQITQKIGESLRREVRVETISFQFSILKGIQLNLQNLSIADDPSFSDGHLISADSIRFDVDALALITTRRILISQAEIISPKMNLIKNASGEINIQKLGHPQQNLSSSLGEPRKEEYQPFLLKEAWAQESVSPQEDSSVPKAVPEADQKISFPQLSIKSIRMKKGILNFTDRSSDLVPAISMANIDAEVSNFSLKENFSFRSVFSLFSEHQNIHVDGLTKIDQGNQAVIFKNLNVSTDLSYLSIPELKRSFPQLLEDVLEDHLEGKINVVINQMSFDQGGLRDLSLNGQLTQGRLQFKPLSVPFEDIHLSCEMTQQDLDINRMTFLLASGVVEGKGKVQDYLNEQRVIANFNFDNIRLEELLAGHDLPVQIEGRFRGSFQGQGAGFDEASIYKSLLAHGQLEILEGKLRNINILKFVLDKLSVIPALEKIEENFPEEYRRKIEEKDTILNSVEFDLSVQNGVLFLDQGEVDADGFTLSAKGSLDITQKLMLDADFYIPEELSKAMISSFKVLTNLQDEYQRIHIPLQSYKGKLKDFKPLPDIVYITTRVGRGMLRDVIEKNIPEEGKEILGNILDGILGDF